MVAYLVAAVVSLLVSITGTPLLIRVLHKKQYGQFIRQDGPTSHFTKRGTPTMGGLVMIIATVLGYLAANLFDMRTPRASGLLLLFLIVGLGAIGFFDDYVKISHERSLGLKPMQKIIGQAFVGITFSVCCLFFANKAGITPGSTAISTVRDTGFDLAAWGTALGLVLFVLWCNFLITAWSNAVNLTDGMDGLAAGCSTIVFAGYTMIGIWQSNQSCQGGYAQALGCYEVRDPRDLTMIAISLMSACLGFLWWNAAPAKIFMGDTGSLALGGAVAGLSVLTRTEFLAVILGFLFLVEVMSDVIQVGYFKATHKRVFRMATIHHHFEVGGMPEVTVVIRFWIVASMGVALGLGLFYAEWLAANHV